MRLRYAWTDLIAWPLMVALLSPLMWHLGTIVYRYIQDTGQ